MAEGIITRSSAKEMIREMCIILGRDMKAKSRALIGDTGQYILLGGVNQVGETVQNDLTELFLEVFTELKVPDPKLILRVNKNTSDTIWRKAIDCILTGCGSPLIINEHKVIEGMKEFGYDEKDVWNFGTSACWEPLIIGKSFDQNNPLLNIPVIESLNKLVAQQKSYESFDGLMSDFKELLRIQVLDNIRDVEFDADRGFLLNGKEIELKGVNVHQDHAGVGAAIPEALMAWRIKQLKKLGCNSYRASHNPMTPAQLDICDREGILVIDENRLSGINTEHLRLLENMIKRDRNHPSIVLWSDGNEEWGLENTIQGTRIAAAMREYTRLLDPTRHSTIANAGGSELIKGLDVVGFNYIAQNDVDNRKKANPTWKIVGTEETTGCGTRGVYFNSPDQPAHMVSINRGTEPGVENVIERGWKFYDERPWAAGLFYWTGFDYRGEPNPLSYPAHDSEFGILD